MDMVAKLLVLFAIAYGTVAGVAIIVTLADLLPRLGG